MSQASEQTESAEPTAVPEQPAEAEAAGRQVLYCTICGAQVPAEAAALHNRWHAQFADPGTFSNQLSPIPEILGLYHGLSQGPSHDTT